VSPEELAQEEDEFLRQEELFVPLLDSAAWKELVAIAEAQIKVREEACLRASHEWPQGAPSAEYLKGAVCGIRLLLATPSQIVATAAELRVERLEREALDAATADREDSE